MTEPPAPGEQSGREWLREMMRPMREYNLWLVKNGHPPLVEESGE